MLLWELFQVTNPGASASWTKLIQSNAVSKSFKEKQQYICQYFMDFLKWNLSAIENLFMLLLLLLWPGCGLFFDGRDGEGLSREGQHHEDVTYFALCKGKTMLSYSLSSHFLGLHFRSKAKANDTLLVMLLKPANLSVHFISFQQKGFPKRSPLPSH